MRFQVFSFASKKEQGFSSDRKILMSLCVLSSTKLSQFFEILSFSQDIYGNIHYVHEIILLRNSDKSLLSSEQNNLK